MAGCGLLTTVYVFIGDSTPWGEYLTVWPPLLWCFLLIPWLVVALLGSSRCWMAVLPSILVIFLLASGDWFGLGRGLLPVQTGSCNGSAQLRVVTWNIDGASGGTDAILTTLEPLSPDIVFFQETPDHAEFLSSATLPATWQDWTYADAGDCGLFCRFPFAMLEAERIGPWDKPQIALCEWPGSEGTTIPLLVVNVRLMLPSLILAAWDTEARVLLSREHRRRAAQYESLAKQVRQITDITGPAATILAGDFNTRGGSVSLQPLIGVAGLQDAWRLAGRGWGATITRDFPVARIDQVWIGDNVRPLSVRVVRGPVSDHKLVIADLRVEK